MLSLGMFSSTSRSQHKNSENLRYLRLLKKIFLGLLHKCFEVILAAKYKHIAGIVACKVCFALD